MPSAIQPQHTIPPKCVFVFVLVFATNAKSNPACCNFIPLQLKRRHLLPFNAADYYVNWGDCTCMRNCHWRKGQAIKQPDLADTP